MAHHKITIESAQPHRIDHDDRKHEHTLRVFTTDYQETEKLARQMLTSWCEAHPGTLATYTITGLSFHDMGSSL